MFNGSITALVTPFTESGEIDLAAFRSLVRFNLEQGSDGLVVAGTTGESVSLSRSELETLVEAALREADGQMPVLAGVASAATAEAEAKARWAGALGVAGLLVVTPFYVRPMQAGLEAHFMAVADASPVPLLLYNVPARTGVDLLPETVARLSAHRRIVGIKEATGSQGRVEELRARCGEDFGVLSGDDASVLGAMKSGADGVISVAANVVPDRMHALCAAADEQDWEEAERLEGSLRPLFEALSRETNPIPVKWALFEMGRIGAALRLPMTPLAEEHRPALQRALRDLGLIAVD